MSRTSILTLTAIAALGTSCWVPSDAFAGFGPFARRGGPTGPMFHQSLAGFHAGRPQFSAPMGAGGIGHGPMVQNSLASNTSVLIHPTNGPGSGSLSTSTTAMLPRNHNPLLTSVLSKNNLPSNNTSIFTANNAHPNGTFSTGVSTMKDNPAMQQAKNGVFGTGTSPAGVPSGAQRPVFPHPAFGPSDNPGGGTICGPGLPCGGSGGPSGGVKTGPGVIGLNCGRPGEPGCSTTCAPGLPCGGSGGPATVPPTPRHPDLDDPGMTPKGGLLHPLIVRPAVPNIIVKGPSGYGQYPSGYPQPPSGYDQPASGYDQSGYGQHSPRYSQYQDAPAVAPVAPAAPATSVAAAPTPAVAAASTCLTKTYLQTGVVMFRDVCVKDWAINATNVTVQVAAKTGCLTKENPQDGVVLFRDVCTNEWAMNPPPAENQTQTN